MAAQARTKRVFAHRTTRIALPALAMLCLLLLAGSLGMQAVAATPTEHASPTLPASTIAERTEQVRSTERAFAKSMADRDLAAFSRFVAPDAVFLSGKEASRGAPAVIEAWRDLFKGAAAPFSWEPDHIEVLPTGQLALSSGPVRNARGEASGRFYSVWRREPDGHWRIVLDHGCTGCTD